MNSLPETISVPGGYLRLRCVIPKIWTQKESRRFGIYWSSKTNHGALYPEPTEAELAAFYQQEHYDKYLSGEAGVSAFTNQFEAPMTLPYRILVKAAFLADRSQQDPRPTLFRLAPERPSLCDLGCGGGTFLESVKSRCSSVVGVDPSQVSATAVRGRGIEFHEGTADNLPEGLPRGAFDLVTMFHSLEHVRDVSKSLNNAASLVKQGGLLLVEVPNMGCIGFRTYPEVWIHTDAGRHLQFFTEQSLKAAMRSAGFEPVATEFTGFTHQFLPVRTRKMQVHWDVLFSDGGVKPVAPRASFGTAIRHLARALVAPRSSKYDIVRVYARKI